MVPRSGLRPFVIGNTNDISASAPSGTITQAIGHFENISNVTSETGLVGNSGNPVNDAYTLQINTNNFTSTACSGSPNANCKAWEQFVQRYRERVLAELGNREPFFYPFKRILFWGRTAV